MFDLFRFIMLRPPEMVEDANLITLHSESELIDQLHEARQSEAPHDQTKQAANSFIESDAFVAQSSTLTSAQSLERFSRQLRDRLESDDIVGLDELRKSVSDNFNMDASTLLQDPLWLADKARLHDSLIAIKIASPQPGTDLNHLSHFVRLIAFIERIAANDSRLEKEKGAKEILGRAIVLPPNLLPLPNAQQASPGNEGDDNEVIQRREALLQKYDNLETAYQFLNQLEPEDITMTTTPLDQVSGYLPQVELTETQTLLRERAGQVVYSEIEKIGDQTLDLDTKLTRLTQIQNFITNENIAFTDGSLPEDFQVTNQTVTRMNLVPATLERLPEEVKSTLAEINVQLEVTSLPVAVERIKDELTQMTAQVIPAIQQKTAVHGSASGNVVIIGSQLFPKQEVHNLQGTLLEAEAAAAPALPDTHGTIKPVGVGDLLVVKQQLRGYEKGEIAFIENILKGEIQSRDVRRSETTEESTLTEQESTSEEERDLQSTERFEMQSESQNVLSIDGDVKSNTLKSPSYGPVVEFASSPESQVRGSQVRSESRARSYGRDVTSRAASRITERTRTQVMRRKVREFEEKTMHAFDNKQGHEHVVGIYQWIDKVYETQVFNYGRRLFYDLVVPEPAAFVLEAAAHNQAEGKTLDKPEPFTITKDGTERPLKPDDITDTNYAYYVACYKAKGVQAPPASYITVSKIIAGSSPPKDDPQELQIPRGYEPAMRQSILTMSSREAIKAVFEIYGRILDINLTKDKVWYVKLGCVRTKSYYSQWQLATYEAILEAYRRQVAAYEERLANFQAALRVGALGQSTAQKRVMERTELKKACITLFTRQHYDLFNGIDAPPAVTYPQLNLVNAEAQGHYIRFFEQAFEWEQLMYQFYSYFWGRKEQWPQKVSLEDNDAQFAEFLKAGAARVLVPVRPGFEEAIVHFMETGEIWQGGSMPTINSPLYVPLLQELQAGPDGPDQGVPYGSEWEVRLPTSLVMLHSGSELPKWEKKDGKWVPEG